LPLKTRLSIAKKWRNDSASAISNKAIDIMDVNEDAVLNVMKKHKIATLIHGHTHRPQIHKVSEGKRIVLGDWESQGWFAIMNKEGFSLKSFPIEP
jgi:UDP-2,3-diacylglucosamine hydrolase